MDEIDERTIRKMARMLRFIAVRGYYQSGDLTEQEAKEVLSGRLSPDDPESVVDDSALLGLSGEEVAKIAEEW